MDIAGNLASVPFLAGIGRAELEVLAAGCRVEQLPRGAYLFHEGQPGDCFHVIIAGRVAAVRMSPRGSRVIFHVAGPGETPGHTELLSGDLRMASAEVLEAATVITAPRRLVLELLDRHPQALRMLSQDLSRIALALNEVVADLVFLDVPQRLARYLLTNVDDVGVVNLGLTQEDAAARLGTTRVSFNQALAGLVRQGMVQSLGRARIRLIDVPALERFVKG